MPFDVVKLDMDFMRQEKREKGGDVIIGAMADMIHELKASILVEGVENPENVKCARTLNGDVAQGYLSSKPLPIEEYKAFVKEYSET